jgi:hypothetical protein
MKRRLAMLNDDLDTIEEKDKREATLHHIRAMHRSIREMKQVFEGDE